MAVKSGNKRAIGGSLGRSGGGLAGAAAGAAIGSVIPVVGNIIGGLAGGIIGSLMGEKIGEKTVEVIEKPSTSEKKGFPSQALRKTTEISATFNIYSHPNQEPKEIAEKVLKILEGERMRRLYD